ncbi:hemolysin family protein [Aurantimonas marina]|uniref:hemolysin family protein n=1 Tax=Aurantimonas marina TaxID=2780508 RepID=UPI0019D2C8A1|nr:hemolysin family protein [Aurantimonas marina]
MLLTKFLIILLLIVLNGFFAMSEIAIVSARKSRLEQMRKEGRRGAASAIRLIEDPTGFLSTVQIGITLVGIVAGAYGGSVFAVPLADLIRNWPVIGPYAGTVAFVLVVVVITYLSLIIGELAPKRFALSRAEAIAVKVAPIMTMIAMAGAPLVWLLRVSTKAVMALVGGDREDGDKVTEEDVKAMIAEGTQTGVFKPKEREMLEGVIRIADRTVRSIMVPRPDTAWLDRRDSADTLLDKILKAGHSRFPVIDTDTDKVVGIVQTKDLLEQQRRTGTIDLAEAMREPLYVHETMPILKLLERFRAAAIHIAIVLDEYSSFEGVATPTDILKGIAGALPEGEDDNPRVIARGDGSWLIDAATPIDAVGNAVPGLLFPSERDYETAAGFVLNHLGHIPDVGERFRWRRWDFEIMDMDGRRIDKLLVTEVPAEAEAESTSIS